jgi:glycosyltransferase involved in cell wall biosynthesis
MRLLIGAQFYPPIVGGEERHVRNLAHRLHAVGHEVDVLTLAPGRDDVGVDVEGGVRVIRVASAATRLPGLYSDPGRPHAAPVEDPAIARAAGSLIAERRYDVVHAHNWIVNSLLRVSRQHATPVVLTLHDYSHVCAVKRMMRDGSPCPGPSLGACLRCAGATYGSATGAAVTLGNRRGMRARVAGVSRFLAVSSAVARRNGLLGGPVRCDVIPNFIPDELLDPIERLAAPHSGGGPIVFVGDLTPDKGVPVLLRAYAALPDAPELVLAGRVGPVPLDLPRGARLLPELAHGEVVDLMRSARFVVVPSTWPDPCPTVVLEAMAVGRAVLATATGGIVDMVTDGETGLLVPPGDEAALCRAMGEMLDPATDLARFGRAGRRNVEHFTASHVVPRIEAVYTEVIGDPGPLRAGVVTPWGAVP